MYASYFNLLMKVGLKTVCSFSKCIFVGFLYLLLEFIGAHVRLIN